MCLAVMFNKIQQNTKLFWSLRYEDICLVHQISVSTLFIIYAIVIIFLSTAVYEKPHLSQISELFIAAMAEIESANGKLPARSRVQWKKKKKSNSSVGPSPFEVPVVAVTSSDDGSSRPGASR